MRSLALPVPSLASGGPDSRGARSVSRACAALGLPFVFKASFDKANRKSHHSARGPGLEQGLENLRAVARTGIRVTTDIHEAWQAAPAAEVVDIVQIPALLCRQVRPSGCRPHTQACSADRCAGLFPQTDLLLAAADTGKIVNVKRGPFADVATMVRSQSLVGRSPSLATANPPPRPSFASQRHAVDKVRSVGNGKVIVTERGTACGPGQLVSDPRSLVALRSTGALVVQDVTHAAQASEQGSAVTGGRWEDGWTIARAAAAVGARGLFIETHPTPDTAASDGAVMVPLQHMQQLLEEAAAIARASRAAPAHRRDE